MEEEKEIGITVKKNEDLSEWYTQVVLKSKMADYAPMKGFIVFMPYSYAIWENIIGIFDKKIKELGHKNAYFPTLIPESFLKKEASHFQGFSPETFIVTKSGNDELAEHLVVRPTSETIMYYSYSRWIRSWRDLPLLINQWNSVLRAEIKMTKPFLRTSEFLWQEGHTVHATKEEADEEVLKILNLYKELTEKYLAIPVISGKKSELEKFAGALYTTTIEALMPDGKALQAATSHNLGQNFAKAFDIKFLDKDGKKKYAWQTSWGMSTRLIGALIMVHGDDKGLILPPKIAPIQVVIIPINFHENKYVLEESRKIKDILVKLGLRVELDDREEYTPGWKFNDWELKGVPLRIEIGPRDINEGNVILVRRDNNLKKSVKRVNLEMEVNSILEEIQNNLYEKAREFLNENIRFAKDHKEFKKILEEKRGFIKIDWCGSKECEERIKEETGATVRVIPFEEKVKGECKYCGKEGKVVAYFAKSY
ncbi:MAG: proline--tRNA ligase [Candidatus Aenigmatarchaeota archaeon]